MEVVNISELDKDQLEEYARKKFGVELDKRRRLPDLIEQVKGFERMKGKPAAEKVEKKDRTPKTCRNIYTGVVWDWNPVFEGNRDLEIIEWE
jgi:hypothetical protein